MFNAFFTLFNESKTWLKVPLHLVQYSLCCLNLVDGCNHCIRGFLFQFHNASRDFADASIHNVPNTVEGAVETTSSVTEEQLNLGAQENTASLKARFIPSIRKKIPVARDSGIGEYQAIKGLPNGVDCTGFQGGAQNSSRSVQDPANGMCFEGYS